MNNRKQYKLHPINKNFPFWEEIIYRVYFVQLESDLELNSFDRSEYNSYPLNLWFYGDSNNYNKKLSLPVIDFRNKTLNERVTYNENSSLFSSNFHVF